MKEGWTIDAVRSNINAVTFLMEVTVIIYPTTKGL